MFILKTASAKMPNSCWGRYGKIAVMEVERDVQPAMISERAKGVIRIVELWDKLNMGGPKSAYALALVEAKALYNKLNAQ